MIDFVKYRFIYLLISSAIILPGAISLLVNGLKPSIEFTGGTIIEYKISSPFQISNLSQIITQSGFPPASIQAISSDSVKIKLPPIQSEDAQKIKSQLSNSLNSEITELKFETLGPTLGKELLKKTVIGLLLAAILILLYVGYAFKNLKYGICATLATLHDTLVVLGSFSLFGKFLGVEADSLFVTALLTTLSFSVHDTIVVFDRIRESQRLHKYTDTKTAINSALNETMVRSLINSLTIIFMLTSLLLLGGKTIHYFTMALLIGTVSGTYSSPFVATQLLLVWDKLFPKN